MASAGSEVRVSASDHRAKGDRGRLKGESDAVLVARDRPLETECRDSGVASDAALRAVREIAEGLDLATLACVPRGPLQLDMAM